VKQIDHVALKQMLEDLYLINFARGIDRLNVQELKGNSTRYDFILSKRESKDLNRLYRDHQKKIDLFILNESLRTMSALFDFHYELLKGVYRD
jgi:hypothetical protein